MTYHDDGSTSYSYHGGNVAYRHFVLNTDGGGFRWVYCIESGIRFGDSDDGYYSEQTDNSQYFNQLPEASRRGIMLASLYGWQPGASLPMAGINADDWYMAAQCIIWEYQQQLRSDTPAATTMEVLRKTPSSALCRDGLQNRSITGFWSRSLPILPFLLLPVLLQKAPRCMN